MGDTTAEKRSRSHFDGRIGDGSRTDSCVGSDPAGLDEPAVNASRQLVDALAAEERLTARPGRGRAFELRNGASEPALGARPELDHQFLRRIEVLGGPLFPESFCDSHPGSLRDCVHSPNCSIRGVWRSLNSLLRVALSGITIDDLKRGEQITAERLGRDWLGAGAGHASGGAHPAPKAGRS